VKTAAYNMGMGTTCQFPHITDGETEAVGRTHISMTSREGGPAGSGHPEATSDYPDSGVPCHRGQQSGGVVLGVLG
jgi:hypothetical protein